MIQAAGAKALARGTQAKRTQFINLVSSRVLRMSAYCRSRKYI
jgi:hypothetical protein